MGCVERCCLERGRERERDRERESGEYTWDV